MQGQYSIDLGRLTPGGYTISVRELSAKDGSVSAEIYPGSELKGGFTVLELPTPEEQAALQRGSGQ